MSIKLKDIGEFGLIDKITQNASLSASVIKGIGDDCAVIEYTKDKSLLYTTDMIIEDIHFKKRGTPPQAIGHKALAVNISDIAACAGIPKWAVVSAGIPANTSWAYISGINKGIRALAKKFKIDIVGGDTNLSEKIIISIALIGEVDKGKLTLRSGAKEKDVIVLSGALSNKPNHLTFNPRLKESRLLAKRFNVNSMIDISDGLLADLNHILNESNKGAIIYESLIPCNQKSGSVARVLNVGEQFELLFTMPCEEIRRLPAGFYPIGEIASKDSGIMYVTKDGKRNKLKPAGYKHF